MEYIDGPNQYIYCANNPMVWIDPFGLCRGDSNLKEKASKRLLEIAANYSDYVADVYEGTRFGAGIGYKAGMNFTDEIKLEAGMHEISGYEVKDGKLQPFYDTSSSVNAKFTKNLELSYNFSKQEASHSIPVTKEMQLDNSLIFSAELTIPINNGGAKVLIPTPWGIQPMFIPSPEGYAVNFKFSFNVKEALKVYKIFRRRENE